MKCIRCQNEVKGSADGYEIENGYIHHGCAMLMDEMPRKKMAISLADLIAAKKKVDAINQENDRRVGRMR